MFIQNMRIDRFGSVVNLVLDNLTQDITLIQGGPETGRTTLLQFVRATLYGFDASTHSRYSPSNSSVDLAGSITWLRGQHQHTIRLHDDGNAAGQFEALDDDRHSSRVALKEALEGISAELFSRLFAVDFSNRPHAAELIDEAANCGFNIEGQAIDTARMQELVGRLATLQSTLATYGSVGQSIETLELRRRELLNDISRVEPGTTRRQGARPQPHSETEAIQRQLATSRQERHALRQAMDEIAAVRQGCRTRFSKAQAAAASSGIQETETSELDTQIERWVSVLGEVATRQEAIGRRVLAAIGSRNGNSEFDADLFALQTSCDCERRQLTRVQAELQVSLRYLEEEREALAVHASPSHGLPNEIARLNQQFVQLDAKETELQQRFDAVTEEIRKNEISPATLEQPQLGPANDLTGRLGQEREELPEMEILLSEIERQKTLLESIGETQRQIRRVEEGGGECSILRTATDYLRRISKNALQRIDVTHGNHVWVSDSKGHRLSWGQLTESARDMVYLSLCLAFVEAHDQRTTPLPLIWKDLFTNFDSRYVPQTTRLLCEFARAGRQILFLSRHEHVASVFQSMNVPCHKLVAEQDWQPTKGSQHGQSATNNAKRVPGVAGDASSPDIDVTCASNEEGKADGPFHLFDDSPIEQSPSVSADNAARLRRLGLTTVGEFLQVSRDDIAAELGYAQVSSSMVAAWRSQARMMCDVAGLREYDARILVSCGITDPSQLRQISPREVRSMIERFATSAEGRATLLSGTEFELSRVTDWVRIAESADGQPRQENGNGTNRQEKQQADVVQMTSTSDSNDLQFFLEGTANVVDAPSIGPRSAERLEGVGVVTVSDLLAADAGELAGRLDNRRMSAKTIVTWQQQTTLVCGVPMLRGHDAQILVAMGVTDVEQLALLEPQDLWKQVAPFADSTAGKRIIRSSKSPDFEEVFHWIESARQAISLNAA